MATTEQHAFWAAIWANPDDDTPRLVYTDWLQENGDEPRAELIRLQCALASLPDDRKAKKARPAMQHRERMLLTANRERWSEPIFRVLGLDKASNQQTLGLTSGSFRRGFPHGFTVDLAGAYRFTTASTPLEPMDSLELRASHDLVGDGKKFEAVANWERARCYQSLSWRNANDEHAWLVTHSQFLGLRELALSGSITDAGATLLATWAGGARLTQLILHSNRITDVGAAALSDSPHLAGLGLIDLRRNPIREAGQRRLTGRFGAAVLLPDD